MSVKKNTLQGIAITGLLLTISLTSCTKMIQPEQAQELRDLREKDVRMNKAIQDKEAQKVKLTRELAARQAETKKCNDDKQFVEEKIKSYPAVLGEPLPEAPVAPPPAVSVPKSSTKKK